MPLSLKNIFIKRVAVVDKGDNPKADVLLFKQADEDNVKEGGKIVKTFEEIIKSMSDEDQEVINAEITKLTDEIAKAKEVKPEKEEKPEIDKIVEKADPETAKIIKAMDDEIKKTKEELRKEQETLQKEREILKKERIAKEVSQFDKLTVPTDDLVDMFMKADEEAGEKIKAILKAANEQLSQANITKTIGENKGSEDEPALSKVEKLAKARMAETKESYPEAYKAVLKENPNLYKEYTEGGV